jgi:hypothetical protein
VAIATKLRRNRDEKPCQSKKLTNRLRRRCHTCDGKVWKVATKKRGNSDENVWQRKNLRRRCYMCVTQNRGLIKHKVRRTIVDIATLPLGLKKKNLHEKLDVGIRD